MTDFNRITYLANKLADKFLRREPIRGNDIDSIDLSEEDKNYIIESLQDAKKVEERNQIIKDFNKSKDDDWKKIKAAIQVPSSNLHFLSVIGKVAAVLLIGVFIGYLTFGNQIFNLEDNSIAQLPIDSIRLELDDGLVKVLSTSSSASINGPNGEVIGWQDHNLIKYNKKEGNELKFHKLYVPYGKTFKVELSDGTVVHMNAGSTLEYPFQFIKNNQRQVVLEGEAYFEVSKDVNRPFIVNTGHMNIRVLGTKFIANSYKEDAEARTILLEGSVAVFKEDETYQPDSSPILSPGQMAVLNKKDNQITREDVDTNIYTDWLDGKLIFSHKPFPQILKRLERHFNCSFDNRNKKLAKQIFTASFEGESLEEILHAFQKNFSFEYSKINNKKIIINP
ncbi:FecR domain-containing protein [Galbibacter sp. PAP.153]|uniref:FecR family protein n=1 Tax=Galbibacter sp. PAP.153 TaxID=3104623 RepID=UPI0030087D0E